VTRVAVLAACVAAFLVGRAIPRQPTAATSRVSVDESTRRPVVRAPSRATPPARAAAPAGAWTDVARADPAAASTIRQQVTETLAGRFDPVAMRACLRDDAVSGSVLVLRFEVDVDSDADAIAIGDAHYIEALEGPPLSDDAGRCLERGLAGHDDVRRPGELVRYTGRVEYQLTLGVGAPNPG
jgi:hypothetical protein